MTDEMEDAVRRRRLAWRCAHRGMKEVDLIFGGFVAETIDRFSAAELDEVEILAELPDNVLLDWILGRKPVPPEYDTPLTRALLEKRLKIADYTAAGLTR
ncbi:succinate dehydrogenase assembly factor 2 [Rhodoligotrophos defluvii]|uniref:FAD assembly factor SdhE n=1 Tax=Rhodoligotrophos defluvii TaxID=2561934 RepID=UPI0010C9EB91|nr:succinate dehydrogenase assembly factor 2 [Rhodoligotrophos defluvii]